MSSLGKIFGKENSLKKASKTEIKGKRRRNIEREREWERGETERERGSGREGRQREREIMKIACFQMQNGQKRGKPLNFGLDPAVHLSAGSFNLLP